MIAVLDTGFYYGQRVYPYSTIHIQNCDIFNLEKSTRICGTIKYTNGLDVPKNYLGYNLWVVYIKTIDQIVVRTMRIGRLEFKIEIIVSNPNINRNKAIVLFNDSLFKLRM